MFKHLPLLGTLSAVIATAAIGGGAFVYTRTQTVPPGRVSIVAPQSPQAVVPTPTSTANPSETAVIDQGDIQTTINASGMLQPNQNVPLAFSASGTVVSLAVAQGDHVLQGQLIATLDNRLALDTVLAAQGQVNLAQLALRGLTDKPREVDVNVTKAALALAQAQLYEALHGVDGTNLQLANVGVSQSQNNLYLQQLNRDVIELQRQKLLQHGQTAQLASQLPNSNAENAPIDTAAFSVQIAQANAAALQGAHGDTGAIAGAQAQVTVVSNALDKLLTGADVKDIARAQASVQAAQSALDQTKANLAKLTLTAPFDGVIAQLNLHIGQQVPTGPAVLLLDTSSFYVDLPINEANIAQVTLGQNVNLTFKALPGKTLTGKVTRVANTGIKSGSVVTYLVRVVLDPSDQPLISSMTAAATIVGGGANVIRIPNKFVSTDSATGNTYTIIRKADGTYHEIQISLGVRNNTYSQVISGLNVGDVVASPQSHLTASTGQ